MTRVDRDGESFIVPAPLLAKAFGISEDRIRQAIRDRRLTTTCEAGVDVDAGRWRLTFRHEGVACRFTVDEAGTILSTSRFPVCARPLQAAG